MTTLTAVGLLLAAVTATSVGMAVHAVIADPVLSALFCFAAVLLDAFKYMAWPAAASMRGRWLPAGLVVSATLFAGVSGWATYDRVLGAVQGRAASVDMRLSDLEQVQEEAARRLAVLDAREASALSQAEVMRQRGMVSKAMELEEAARTAASKDRQAATERLDAASEERATLLKGRGADLPGPIAQALAIGFALALEIVPVLIFLAGQQPAVAAEPRAEEQLSVSRPPRPAETAVTADLPQGELSAVSEEPERLPVSRRDEELLSALVALGTRVPKVKEFAKANSIGNSRAIAVYRAAEAAGYIKKTPAGYVSTSGEPV